MDLYKTLGVGKNATVEQVRNAYRKKAKKAHPDVGGSIEEFALVKRAHDILTDAPRRMKYDATSDESEAARDNGLAEVVQIMVAALDQVLIAIDNKGREPTEFDIISDMKILLGGKLDDIRNGKSSVKQARKKTEKLLGRFKVKKGTNYLESVILQKLDTIDRNIAVAEKQEDNVQKALKILKDFTFKYETGSSSPQQAYNMQSLMNMAMRGGL